MALKEYLLLTILITTSIGISTALTWNPNIHHYESYDLEKGPVFYEAYYPESKEETRKNYQEKRYFDRGAVLERTYQVPSESLAYPGNNLRVDSYQNPNERFQYPDGYIDPRLPTIERNRQVERGRNFSPDQDYTTRNNVLAFQPREPYHEDTRDESFSNKPGSPSFDVKEITNLARRAISRDLENWNALEGYLDRTNYRDQHPYNSPNVDIDSTGYNNFGETVNGRIEDVPSLLDSYEERRSNLRREKLYEEVRRQEDEATKARIRPSDIQSTSNVIRRLNARDLAGRNTFGILESIRNQNQRLYPQERIEPGFDERTPPGRTSILNQGNLQSSVSQESIVDPYPPENIFEPRPQVINYIFSKKPNKPVDIETQNVSSTKSTPIENAPRNYGDNLIQEEMKKTEEAGKDVKVTSIEVSEVPRHKTRHHHGEWPKRDYSRRHQS